MSEQELVIVEAEYVQLGTIRAESPADVVRRATNIASELASVIKSQKLSTRISGRDFVRVEGWATLGAMLGVLPRELETERLEDGSYVATVELVRVSDSAIIGRGSALCGMDETWGKRPEYARRSMAITRATGKAYRLAFSWIMTLAGYEPTPAEEMDGVIVEQPTRERQPARKKESSNDNGAEKWWQFVQRAKDELGYENSNHIENTLQKETGKPDQRFWDVQTGAVIGNPDDLWTILVDHQVAKQATAEAA